MSTLFVERSGACVGGDALIDEKALERVRTALAEKDRARLHWMVGYVGNRLLAPDEIRDMGTWMDLFGHAREVGIDMTQIRSFIDSTRGERFLQKHEVRQMASEGGANFSTQRNGHSPKALSKKQQEAAKAASAPARHAANGNGNGQGHANGHASKSIKVGATVQDLDRRRSRSGRIIEVGAKDVTIEWSSGRVNKIALERLTSARLFSVS